MASWGNQHDRGKPGHTECEEASGEANRRKESKGGPSVVVACVPNDFHEIAAMTIVGLLQKNGWKATYLGPDSKIEMLRLACQRHHAKLVVLSCVLEQSLKEMKGLVRAISAQLLPLCSVVIGGNGITQYVQFLEEHGIRFMNNVKDVKQIAPRLESMESKFST